MKRKHILILVGCALCVSLILAALYASSPLSKGMYRANFDRKFVSDTLLSKQRILGLPNNYYYIAGTSANRTYLGNWRTSFHMIISNNSSLDTQHVRLQIKDLGRKEYVENFRIKVDSPYFYLTNGSLPGLFRGELDAWRAYRFMQDSAYFVEAVPMGPTSFALRSYNIQTKKYELAKEFADPPYFEFKYGLLEKQVDGLFCVEGALHYNKQLRNLVYIYSYRNEYILMDTNLNLIQRRHTIDTFKHAQIKTAYVESENYSTLATPPAIINGRSCVDGNFLFVKSNLLAKNEDQKKFEKSVVVDVYDLAIGKYSYSFYIPMYKNARLTDFKVLGNHLICIFGQYLILYDLNSEALMIKQGKEQF